MGLNIFIHEFRPKKTLFQLTFAARQIATTLSKTSFAAQNLISVPCQMKDIATNRVPFDLLRNIGNRKGTLLVPLLFTIFLGISKGTLLAG